MNPEESRTAQEPTINRFDGDNTGWRWVQTDVLSYKPTGSHFSRISRQVLFDEEHGLPVQVRYFEIAEGGHSTLERHEHVHAVIILTGRGEVLLGDRIEQINTFDTVYVPEMSWHQFRASRGSVLGFLCLVDCNRDRPQRPSPADLEKLAEDAAVGAFIRT